MIAALIASGSGAWYAVALVAAFAVLTLAALSLNALVSLPDRWESEVDQETRHREGVRRALTDEARTR